MQAGHSGGIRSLAFSPDGRYLASSDEYGTTVLWNPKDGTEIREFHGAADALAFSPDSRVLAVADGYSVVLWDPSTGAEVRRLNLDEIALSLSFTPDSKRLAVGIEPSNTVDEKKKRLPRMVEFDLLTGQAIVLREAIEQTGQRAVVFSPNGNWLAAASEYEESRRLLWDRHEGSAVKLWNSSGELVRDFSNGNDEIWTIAFSPSADRIAIGTGQIAKDVSVRRGRISVKTPPDLGRVRVFDTQSGRELWKLTAPVDEVAFSPDGRTLAVGGISLKPRIPTEVVFCDAKSGRVKRKFTDRSGPLAFSPDGTWFASVTRSGNILLWDMKVQRDIRQLSGNLVLPYNLSLSADGRLMATNQIVAHLAPEYTRQAAHDRSFRVWDLDAGIQTQVMPGIPAESVAFTQSGPLRVVLPDDTVRTWDVPSHEEIRSTSFKTPDIGVNGWAFSSDDKYMAAIDSINAAYKDRAEARVWEIDTGREISALRLGPGAFSTKGFWAARQLAFSHDAQWLAITGYHGETGSHTIAMWRVGTNNELRLLTDPRPPRKSGGSIMDSVAFSPDGKLVAGASQDGYLDIWSWPEGKEVQSLECGWGVREIVFTPDGHAIATGGRDREIKIWEVKSGRLLHTLTGFLGEIEQLAFANQGKLLVAAVKDGTIRFWDVAESRLLLSIYMPTGKDWVAITPDGLFDGSNAGWDKVHWRFSDNTLVPVESYFNEFFYPGLLGDIIAGKRPQAPRDIAQLDRRQPRLKLALADERVSPGATLSSRNVTVRITASEAPPDAGHSEGGGVQDVRLFRNGSLVHVWHHNVLPPGRHEVVLETMLPITAGANRLNAYAFNYDNIKSLDASFTITGAQTLRRKGTAYILAAGIDEYANHDFNLRYAASDATDFAAALRAAQGQLNTFAQTKVVTLLNQDATKANILAALSRVAGVEGPPASASVQAQLVKLDRSQPEDSVFIYFAGHGDSWQNHFYLIPHDLGFDGEPGIYTPAQWSSLMDHSVSDAELQPILENLDASRITLVIDACKSGQAIESDEKRQGPINSQGLAQLAYDKGMYILTASQSQQAALEVAELQHGLLTYALVEEGLKRGLADQEPRDGKVDIREWLDYAIQRVPQMQETKIKQGNQKGMMTARREGPEKEVRQQPRAFYPRDPEIDPFIVATVKTFSH